LDGIATQYAPAAFDKGLQLIHGVSRTVNPMIEGDKKHLRLILDHLVENAIKFTDEGHVSIWVEPDSQPASQALRFLVEDTGVGIERAKQPGLFKAFAQGDTSMSRRHGGSGLGLAIVSQLVKVLKGEVGVRSDPGTGSCFWFTALARSQPARYEMEPAKKPLEGLSAIICDQNAMSRRACRHVLQRMGLVVSEWKDECRARLEKAYDLVVVVLIGVDWHRELLEIRRRLPGHQPALFLVNQLDPRALISSELPAFSQVISTASGYDVLRKELEVFLLGSQALQSTAHGAQEAVPAPGQEMAALKILVADDNPVSSLLIRTLLTEQGAEVVPANSETEVVELARLMRFDLILLDMALLEGDVIAAVEQIRRYEMGKKHTPIVAVTAPADGGRPFIELGIDDYLCKPIEAPRLLDMVEKWASISSSLS
jgi:two-component system sensor histidine kinase BarA